ncbi:ELF4-like 1 [Striga asiatica]|uniref:ELF4-like 1 n=1 Tax=Striga asiatica TaxID=4170 RepID=A0A5A7R3K5_STRAF|nr:ELF4-like 1 [Striga asiatica]
MLQASFPRQWLPAKGNWITHFSPIPSSSTLSLHLCGFLSGDAVQIQRVTGDLQFAIQFNDRRKENLSGEPTKISAFRGVFRVQGGEKGWIKGKTRPHKVFDKMIKRWSFFREALQCLCVISMRKWGVVKSCLFVEKSKKMCNCKLCQDREKEHEATDVKDYTQHKRQCFTEE